MLFVGRRVAGLLATGVTAALLVAACGSGGNGSSSSAAGSGSGSTSGSCGKAPTGSAPPDRDKVLSTAPAAVQKLYAGDTDPVYKSAWADWKPSHPAPYTVGVSFNALVNPFNAGLYKQLNEQLKSDPQIGNVIAYTAASPSDVAGQIQQMQSLVQQKVDVIITLATSGSTASPVVKQAGDAGIPMISLTNYVDSPQAINLTPNTFQNVMPPAASIVSQVGKKGNVLIVHGIPGTQSDVDETKYFKQVISACPDLKLVGEVNGMYNPSVVKSEVLKFLATHPQKIDVVFQTATMAPAVMQAFQSVGRPMPAVIDLGAQVGSVAYWHDHKSTYKGGGAVGSVGSQVALATQVTARLLAGQGPKTNVFIWEQPYLTAADLDQYYQPGSTLDTPGTVDSPPSTYTTSSTLDALFNHPERKAP